MPCPTGIVFTAGNASEKRKKLTKPKRQITKCIANRKGKDKVKNGIIRMMKMSQTDLQKR